MLFLDFPRPVHNRIKKLLNKGGSNRTVQTECTDSTIESIDHMMDASVQVQINEEKELIELWKGLKHGAYKYTKSIHFTFGITPTQKFGQMKQLWEVFEALGQLPHLEEVCFTESAVFLESVNKLFKESLLRKLKFHHCLFIVAKRSHENLWNGIQHQARLEVLEIVDCTYMPHHKIRHNRLSLVSREVADVYSFPLPSFLQEQRLPMLRRLVLDSCILDCTNQKPFVELLSHNTSLEELEISPIFEIPTAAKTSGIGRRCQYQARKRAIQTFMTQTVPTTLASSNNKHLRKLVISLDDYLLENVYEDAMTQWIELVQHNNYVLTSAHMTHEPLLSSTKDSDGFGLYRNSWLECNLQYYLRLNRQLQTRQIVQFDDTLQEEVVPDLVSEAIDISCLRSLLRSRPDIDASTQSTLSYQPTQDTSLFASTRSLPLVCG